VSPARHGRPRDAASHGRRRPPPLPWRPSPSFPGLGRPGVSCGRAQLRPGQPRASPLQLGRGHSRVDGQREALEPLFCLLPRAGPLRHLALLPGAPSGRRAAPPGDAGVSSCAVSLLAGAGGRTSHAASSRARRACPALLPHRPRRTRDARPRPRRLPAVRLAAAASSVGLVVHPPRLDGGGRRCARGLSRPLDAFLLLRHLDVGAEWPPPPRRESPRGDGPHRPARPAPPSALPPSATSCGSGHCGRGAVARGLPPLRPWHLPQGLPQPAVPGHGPPPLQHRPRPSFRPDALRLQPSSGVGAGRGPGRRPAKARGPKPEAKSVAVHAGRGPSFGGASLARAGQRAPRPPQ
jgi:hypothetical protein